MFFSPSWTSPARSKTLLSPVTGREKGTPVRPTARSPVFPSRLSASHAVGSPKRPLQVQKPLKTPDFGQAKAGEPQKAASLAHQVVLRTVVAVAGPRKGLWRLCLGAANGSPRVPEKGEPSLWSKPATGDLRAPESPGLAPKPQRRSLPLRISGFPGFSGPGGPPAVSAGFSSSSSLVRIYGGSNMIFID